MHKRRLVATFWMFLPMGAINLILGVGGTPQEPADKSAPVAPQTPPAPTTAARSQLPNEKAWGILREGLNAQSADKRTKATRALSLLPGNAEAESAAIAALQDKNANVRMTAATALGSIGDSRAKPDLEKAAYDSEPSVVLAAANALLILHDDEGYNVYYDVLTGERRADKGLIKDQLQTLKDKKKLAEMGIEEGIGFIPFGGMSYEFFKTVTKDDSSPVRAAAAKKLARDPNPKTTAALLKASTDKKWTVRAAALEALGQRGDRVVISSIAKAMDDEKDVVRFTAAACIAHLSDLPEQAATSNQ